LATQAAGQGEIATGVSQPDGEEGSRELRIGQGAERPLLPPEVACAALVDIEGELVARLHIGPEPALTLGIRAKTEPLPLGGGGAQQICPLDGSGIGEGQCLWIVVGLIAPARAVEGGIVDA